MVPFRCQMQMARGRDLPDVLTNLPAQAMDQATIVADTEFRRLESQLFTTEGESGESKWPELSPEYAARKARWRAGRTGERRAQRKAAAWFSGAKPFISPIGANKILQLTGELKRGLTTRGGGHVAHWYRDARGQHVIQLGVEGRSGRIAEYHHAGRPPLKKRPPIVITQGQYHAMFSKIHHTLVPYIIRGIKAAARLGRLGGK